MNGDGDEPGLQRLVCRDCGGYPDPYWHHTAESIVLVCSCGEQLVPGECVLDWTMVRN